VGNTYSSSLGKRKRYKFVKLFIFDEKMRGKALLLATFLVLVLAVMPLANAATYNIEIDVIGPDNKALGNVDVVLYATTGTSYTNKTNTAGKANFTQTSAGDYLVVVKSTYYIIKKISVSADAKFIVNASEMKYANFTSVPITVDFNLTANGFSKVVLKPSTNKTVYSSEILNATFPKEISKFPYKYVYNYTKYDATTTNKTEISLDMTKNYVVTANYVRQFFFVLEYWMVAAIVIVIVLAIAVAWYASSRTAKAMIENYRASTRKFVKRKI